MWRDGIFFPQVISLRHAFVCRQNGLSLQGTISDRFCLFLKAYEKVQVKTSTLKLEACVFCSIMQGIEVLSLGKMD